mgnify:CR=1 FL=1
MKEDEIRSYLRRCPLMFSRIAVSGYRVEELLKRTALICGAGGIGVVVAEILARTGIGKIIIVDKDVVGEENFNRLGFTREDVGSPKAEALRRKLLALRNSPTVPRAYWLKAEAYHADILEMKGFWKLVNKSDVVFDCLDDLGARLEVNRYAVKLGKPMFSAGTSRNGLRGTIRTVIPGSTPCLRCYFPPGSLLRQEEALGFGCDASLATTMTMVASIQADQAFKYLLGYGRIAPVIRVSLEEEVRVMPDYNVVRRPDCEDCGSL